MADLTTTESSAGGGTGLVDKVKQRAAEQLSSQKNRAFDGIGSVAQAVRQSTHQLRDQQHDTLAGYVEQAADQIDRFARQLREKDVSELLNDAQRLARRQPAIFVGSAFALGLLGARFLKSSTDHVDRPSGGEYARRWAHESTPATASPSSSSYGDRSSSGTRRTTGGVAGTSTSTTSTAGPLTSAGSASANPSSSSSMPSAGAAVTGGASSSGTTTATTTGTSTGTTAGSTRANAGTKSDSPASTSGRTRRSGSETERS